MPAGRAPERSTIARSSTSCWVNDPRMIPESEIRPSMVGADRTRPSSTIARGLPMFAPVQSPKIWAPSWVSEKLTTGSWNCPRSARAVLRSRPVITGRFSSA